MRNRLIIIGADFSANALIGQIDTSYSLRVDVESVEVSRTTPATIYATSELQTFNDDVYVGSTPAPISVNATGGLIATVGAPEGNVYPITLDASAVSQEQCEITIAQIGTSNIATVEAICQIYAIKRTTNAPLMDVVYAQGWSASPDYMTFDEAAKVKTFGKAFQYNEEIETFDEGQYFTGYNGTCDETFRGCKKLRKVTLAGKPTIFNGTFLQVDYANFEADVSRVDFTNCTRLSDPYWQQEVIDISHWTDSSKLTNCTRPFTKGGDYRLRHLILPENFSPTVGVYAFGRYALNVCERVEGWINYLNTKDYSYSFDNTYAPAPLLRRFEARYIGGPQTTSTTIDMRGLRVWGVNSEESPDAEESFKNTMRYLYDRAADGLSTITITLSTNTKAILNADATLLAEVVAKGYTIA